MPKQFHDWLINQIGTIDILGYMHCEAHGQQTGFFCDQILGYSPTYKSWTNAAVFM